MCASAWFIGVHISLTSGCKGLLLHRYLTSSGYTPPIHPHRKQKGGDHMQIEKRVKSPQHHIAFGIHYGVLYEQIKL